MFLVNLLNKTEITYTIIQTLIFTFYFRISEVFKDVEFALRQQSEAKQILLQIDVALDTLNAKLSDLKMSKQNVIRLLKYDNGC